MDRPLSAFDCRARSHRTPCRDLVAFADARRSLPAGVRTRLIALACPLCRGALEMTNDTAHCRACRHTHRKQNGVWHMLRPERVAPVENFLTDYTKIRLAEGRGSVDAAFYR